MQPGHCPDRITLPDGTVCEYYESFTDSYFGGIVKVKVCNYRCPDRKVHSRWRLHVLGLPASAIGGDTYDPDQPPDLPDDHPCEETVTRGESECRLVGFWVLRFLFGLMGVEVCIYACDDGQYYHSRWRTSFLGIRKPWRSRESYPYWI